MTTPSLPDGVLVFERGWLSANNILFTRGPDAALIDSGYCTHSAQTLDLVAAALQGRSLDLLVNTHLHSDHCGGNAALQAKYAALRTVIPPGHARQVNEWDTAALTYEPTGQLCPRYSFDDLLQPGKVIRLGDRDWEIHAASGHDPHSVIFFEPASATLVSADALWENGFGVVFPELEGEDAFWEVSATLDVIEKLAPRTVIPGHGRVFSYSTAAVDRARSRLASFTIDPLRHAQHAAKVLLKFKLLDVQRQSTSDFLSWAERTPYFGLIATKFFPDSELSTWLHQLCDELVRAGVATYEDDSIVNA